MEDGVDTGGQRESGERGLRRGRGQGGAYSGGQRHTSAIGTKQPADGECLKPHHHLSQ